MEAAGRLPAPARPTVADGTSARAAERWTVHFAEGSQQVPLFDRAALGAGDGFHGPAIVTQLDATTIVPPGWTGRVHASGALLLRHG